MKPVVYNTLEGLKLTVLNYESYEEADAAAGRPNAMLDEGNRNLTYRGALAVGRSALCEAIEKATGIAFKTTTVMKDDKEVEVPDETEGAYLKRVRAEKGMTENLAAWTAFAQPIADQVSATGDEGKALAVDIKEPDKKGKPKTLPKEYKEAAERCFANGSQDKWAQTFTLTYTGEKEKDVEILGWAIRADVLRKQREQQASYA